MYALYVGTYMTKKVKKMNIYFIICQMITFVQNVMKEKMLSN
ncbi:hypothetical protein VIC_000465 [Vibrio coralliilyticus ATCC BAA-450]|nr:hypothetical protein VIC_000465 [Vibrio coralliilyticus ATCC BAA-450]